MVFLTTSSLQENFSDGGTPLFQKSLQDFSILRSLTLLESIPDLEGELFAEPGLPNLAPSLRLQNYKVPTVLANKPGKR